jgi:hypothetical protein
MEKRERELEWRYDISNARSQAAIFDVFDKEIKT